MQDLHRLVALFALSSPIWLHGCSGAITDAAANRMNSFQLMTAAAAAWSTEEAGFLFYAGQMRYQIDKQVYPPVGKGGDGPGPLNAALGATVGSSIGQRLANDPVAMANVAKRLTKWTPTFAAGYDPGWKYQTALNNQAAAEIVAATRKEALLPLQSKIKLSQNQEYVRLGRDLAHTDALGKRVSDYLEKTKGNSSPYEIHSEYDAAVRKTKNTFRRMQEIEWELVPESRWHARVGWKAKDYFHDQKVLALCRAIEANDVAEMERPIAAGADVNAIGTGGMTPLLWAFPDRKLKRFECLLRHGANPNVFFESDFGVGSRPFHPVRGSFFPDRGCHAGQSVMHLASRSPFIEYLRLVVAHGGDVNLVDKKTGETPLDIVLDRSFWDTKDRVELLIDHKADLNRYCRYRGGYPAMQAVKSGDYDVALLLLEAGADPGLYQPDGERKLIHFVLREKEDFQYFDKRTAAQFESLVKWLERHGESLDSAQADENQWARMHENALGPEGHAEARKRIVDERNGRQRRNTTRP